jgi:predicted AlkP superfamily pyrophosphatase or phosphodiesterase
VIVIGLAAAAVALVLAPARTLADEPRRRVVLIQVDAVRADLLDQFLADGTLPANGGFATLARSFKATFDTVVTPTLTTPNLTTMVTGVYPQKHGAIANVYPPLTGSVTSGIWAHQQPLPVDGLWSPALRAGKKVGLIRTLGVSDTPMTNTWALNIREVDPLAADQLIRPAAADWGSDLTGWNLGEFAAAKSPRVMTFTLQDDLTAPESYSFNVVALDRVISGTYDALVIDDDRNLADGYFGARPMQDGIMTPTSPLTQTGNWSSVIFTRTNTTTGLTGTVAGAYLKLYEFITNPLQVSIYATGVWYNPGYPRTWLNGLYQSIGPFPRLAPVAGVTTEQDGRDFLHRSDNFFRDATLDVLKRPDWDMVITYQSIVDNFEHAYLLTDPRQLSYTNPISLTYWNYIRESYQAVDTAIVAISNTVGLTQTDIFVASDHGQSPTHTTLQINRLLAQNGLSVTSPITAYAQPGGGYAFIYINTTTRAGGVISPAGTPQYTATQDAIVNALENLTDTDRLTGEIIYPFDHVIRKQDLAAQGLGINTVGDVYASVIPGYYLDGATDAGPITSPIAYGGTHGYAPDQPTMYGVFLAAGPHIGRLEPRPARLIDVAPTIASILGVGPLPEADGTALNLTRWLNYLPVFYKSNDPG